MTSELAQQFFLICYGYLFRRPEFETKNSTMMAVLLYKTLFLRPFLTFPFDFHHVVDILHRIHYT